MTTVRRPARRIRAIAQLATVCCLVACTVRDDKPVDTAMARPRGLVTTRCAAIAADPAQQLRDTFKVLLRPNEPGWVQVFEGRQDAMLIVATYYGTTGQSHQTYTFEGGRLLCVRVDNALYDTPRSGRVVQRDYRRVAFRDTMIESLDGAGGDTTELRPDALRALAVDLRTTAETLQRLALAHRKKT